MKDYSLKELKEILKSKLNTNTQAAFAFNRLEELSDDNFTELLDDEMKMMILKEMDNGNDKL